MFDSIYMDVPMSKVKFNASGDYAYIQNFKVLQSMCALAQPPLDWRTPFYADHVLTAHTNTDTFLKHQVDKPIPVESLVKCKMQDNLEFLQWTKKFWDLNFPDHDYDAVARRKGGAMPAAAAAPRAAAVSSSAARRGGGTTPSTGPRIATAKAGPSPATAALQAENATLKETVTGLERERDFYFSKLRDIELLIQQAVEDDPELEKQEDGLVKHIQSILYSTEEGFEIPAEGEGLDDQETF